MKESLAPCPLCKVQRCWLLPLLHFAFSIEVAKGERDVSSLVGIR